MGPIRAPPPLTITEPTIVIVSAKKTINRSSILDDLPLITNRTQFALYCKRQSKSLLLIWLRNVLILGLSVLYISCFLKLIIPSRKPTLQPLRSSSAPFLRLLVPSACLLWLDSIWALVHGITITDHFLTLFFLTLIGVVAVIIFSRRVEREIIVLHSLSKSLLIYRQNAMGLTSIQLLCPNDIMDIFIIEAFVGCTARYLLTLRLKGKTPSVSIQHTFDDVCSSLPKVFPPPTPLFSPSDPDLVFHLIANPRIPPLT